MSFSLVGHIVIEHGRKASEVTDSEVVHALSTRCNSFQTARQGLADMWAECWALYVGSPEGMEYARRRILHTVGDENQQYWHSRINTGKTYEIIENMVGYLMSSLFPNDDWFTPMPVAPGYVEMVKPLKTLMSIKMTDAKFKQHAKVFIRQLLITGISTMALPWRYETMPYKKQVRYSLPTDQYATERWTTVVENRVTRNEPEYMTLDSYDLYFDPTANDPNTADVFRKIIKTPAEVAQCIQTGYYKNIEVKDIKQNQSPSPYDDRDKNRSFLSITSNGRDSDDKVEVWEFWGDVVLNGVTVKNVLATYIDDRLVRFEPNPYWDGRPFVTAQFIPLIGTPYGLSAVIPNMGLLHELNVITNSRLDNIQLHIDKMYEVVEDGLLEDDNITTEPGKIFKVREKGTINPIDMGQANFVVTYQESQYLQNTANANFGIGPALGNQPMRSGERVTAQEIIAMQDAGGNRLSSVFEDIEMQFLLNVLQRTYGYMQQFIRQPEMVPVTGENPDQIVYYWIGPDDLKYKFRFKALGSRYVVAKKRFFDDLQVLFNALQAMPEVRQQINFDKLLYEIMHRLSFDDPASFIKQQEAPPAPDSATGLDAGSGSTSALGNGMEDIIKRMGGAPVGQALSNQMQIDPQSVLSQLAGNTTPQLGDVAPGMDTAQLPPVTQ